MRITHQAHLLLRASAQRCALAALLFGVLAAPSRAAVTTVFDVLPADNPFTELVFEGIPITGNFIDTSLPADEQEFWESAQDIIVGQRSFGRLDIDGNSFLNYQDLIIGDEGTVGSQTRQGTGFVLITGVGASYSNDPEDLPPGLPANFGSVNPRSDSEGFDLYVGRAGVGTLQILGGGRVVVQDLTVIGDQENSLGTVVVDGFASFLQTGGFEESGGPVGATRQMTIGLLGRGDMTISNGGTVIAEAVQNTGAQEDTIGAVIGGDAFDTDAPEEGGTGIVTVTGPTSKWIVGGTLQLGGFHDTGTGPFSVESGEDAQYDNTVGTGTLNVVDGALVSVRPAIDADPEEDELRILLGRRGTLNLDGGYVTIGSSGQPDGRQDNIALINDGVISGSGNITTGLFRNRFFGEIRINPGQKLFVSASSEFLSPITDIPPLVNWGLIELIGTRDARAELEFERALTTPEGGPVQPFINAALETQPAIGRGAGQITASHATLRFRSGMVNQGKLTFTAGDNLVVGPVVNNAAILADGIPAGVIAVAGNETTVTFEDHFINNGEFEMLPNASLALFINNFTQTVVGASTFTLGGRPSGAEVSFVSVLGDIDLAGTLNVELFSTGTNPIQPMAGDVFPIMAGAAALNGVFNFQNFPLLPPGLDWVVDYDRIAATVALRVVDLTGIVGADFNGDGVVNSADLAIWLANAGIAMGASPAQGDADGDGDVDGDDFLIWQQSRGLVPGSGAVVADGQAPPGTVPEPASALMLICGSLLALAHRRRWNT